VQGERAEAAEMRLAEAKVEMLELRKQSDIQVRCGREHSLPGEVGG
jgi:hypothetical protein